jgi:glutathione S-transferase
LLTLYHAWASTCSQKVRLCLAEKAIDYDEVVVNLRRFDQLAPEFLALNPAGFVPVIVHDGFVLTESTIINEYLDDTFQSLPLRPSNARKRALVAQWSRFIDEVTSPAVKAPSFQRNMRPFLLSIPAPELEAILAQMPDTATAGRWRAAASEGIPVHELEKAHADLRLTLDRMATALKDATYLADETVSLADINMLPFVHRIASFTEYDLARQWPLVTRWYERMRARPSFAKATMVEQTATRDQQPVA